MCSAPQAAIAVVSLLVSQQQAASQKNAFRRAQAEATRRESQNLLRQNQSQSQYVNQQSEANRSKTQFALDSIEAQREGNAQADQFLKQELNQLDLGGVQNSIDAEAGDSVEATNRAIGVAEEQGHRATQSGVEGNISEALSTQSATNKAELNQNTARLSDIYSKIQAITQNPRNEAIRISDVAQRISQTQGAAQQRRRAALTQGQIAGQVAPYKPPYLDNSTIEVDGGSGTADLLALGLEGYRTYANSQNGGSFQKGFSQ